MLGDHIVVAGNRRISVIHVLDPSQPQLVAEWIPENSYGSPIVGFRRDRVYVADAIRTLSVLRIDGLPPEVRFTVAGDDASTLAWPSTTAGFALESSISPTASTWDPVAGTAQLVGEEFQLIIPLDDPARLFRLRKP
jgi:hypothetical protein